MPKTGPKTRTVRACDPLTRPSQPVRKRLVLAGQSRTMTTFSMPSRRFNHRLSCPDLALRGSSRRLRPAVSALPKRISNNESRNSVRAAGSKPATVRNRTSLVPHAILKRKPPTTILSGSAVLTTSTKMTVTEEVKTNRMITPAISANQRVRPHNKRLAAVRHSEEAANREPSANRELSASPPGVKNHPKAGPVVIARRNRTVTIPLPI